MSCLRMINNSLIQYNYLRLSTSVTLINIRFAIYTYTLSSISIDFQMADGRKKQSIISVEISCQAGVILPFKTMKCWINNPVPVFRTETLNQMSVYI